MCCATEWRRMDPTTDELRHTYIVSYAYWSLNKKQGFKHYALCIAEIITVCNEEVGCSQEWDMPKIGRKTGWVRSSLRRGVARLDKWRVGLMRAAHKSRTSRTEVLNCRGQPCSWLMSSVVSRLLICLFPIFLSSSTSTIHVSAQLLAAFCRAGHLHGYRTTYATRSYTWFMHGASSRVNTRSW